MDLDDLVDLADYHDEYCEGVAIIELLWMRRSISMDKATEMASANQFYDFILEHFAFVGGVAIISVVPTILGHVSIEGVQGFTWWWDEVGLERFVEKV